MTSFNESNYIKVHNLALDYKNGNIESAEKLIECFNLFIFRYANFLCYGVCDITNYSLRTFVSLYIDNKNYRKLLPMYKYKPFIEQQFGMYAQRTSKLFDKYTFDELYNECICVLLKMAKQYKDSRPSFHTYVSRCYHYELERNLKPLIKDPLIKISNPCVCDFVFSQNSNFHSLCEYSYEELIESINKDVELKNSNSLTIEDDNSIYDIESLNINWINGITCSEEFKDLTPFERELLVSNYILKKTDTQIADELGLCRATINRKKAHAKKVLSDNLKKNNKLNYKR